MSHLESPIEVPPLINDPMIAWESLKSNLSSETLPLLQQAFGLAQKAHHGQVRHGRYDIVPVPYIVHPLRVALILSEEWQVVTPESLTTALLHDTLEDIPYYDRADMEESIQRIGGAKVFDAVHLLTKPPLPHSFSEDVKGNRDARYFKVLFGADYWVRLVKCADRLDNLRDAIQWGDIPFWERYSSETIGWHLYLARETSPLAEVALFKALVDGERLLRGRTPVWADGNIIDPVAAQLVPEEVAKKHRAVGLALQGDRLIVGVPLRADAALRDSLKQTLYNQKYAPYQEIRFLEISDNALEDAHLARLFGE